MNHATVFISELKGMTKNLDEQVQKVSDQVCKMGGYGLILPTTRILAGLLEFYLYLFSKTFRGSLPAYDL